MWAIVITLGLIGVLSPVQEETHSLDEIVGRIQSHLDGVRDFQAHFTQRYHRQIVGKVIEEKGIVAVKKPGRMRWDYLSPEEKLFVTDGTKSYFYVPEEKQVIVGRTASGSLGLTSDSPLALLAGRSRLVEAFEVTFSDTKPQMGGVMLRLLPRHPQEDFDQIELEVEPSSGKVRRVVLVDSLSNRTEFVFENIKENQNLPDTLFLFTIPSGVDIVMASDSPSTPRP
jgi:outer membrane lipoprotein carrier protein